MQALVNTHPYHVDSLLQLSEVCRINEDYQMAAELIGKSRLSDTLFSILIEGIKICKS